MDFKTKMFFVIIAVCLVIGTVILNKYANNKCLENGGQIIHNSIDLNSGCIMPVGKK